MHDAEAAKAVVAAGYDRIAERYAVWASGVRVAERAHYTHLILDALPAGATILDLGCGGGALTTQQLAEKFSITGVDLSARQVTLAREQVPKGTFIHADMTTLTFPSATFDAVISFYAITHVPRVEHATLLKKIATWLRPGGLFIAAMGATGTTDVVEADWLGAPMYFSHFDAATNCRLIREAGLTLLGALEETAEEDGQPATFLWIVARAP